MNDMKFSIIHYLSLMWIKNTELRFNQLIMVLQTDYSIRYPNYKHEGKPDLFYLEDDKFLEYLKVKVEE